MADVMDKMDRKDASMRKSNQYVRGWHAVGYANHFKLYSSFCASHSKAQKVLVMGTSPCPTSQKPYVTWWRHSDVCVSGDNDPLHEFLRARNPRQQHSSTLESYLIKPIQRILKYPLLLKQLKDITHPDSDEHKHLTGNNGFSTQGRAQGGRRGRDRLLHILNRHSSPASQFGQSFLSWFLDNLPLFQILLTSIFKISLL